MQPLNYLYPLFSLAIFLSFLPSASPPLLPHRDGLTEIILKWKKKKESPGFPGSLSNHICLSQRRQSSNWGTHFLILLKGHLLFGQCKHSISLYDCGAFFPFNNQGQCLEFMYLILVYLKHFSDLGFFEGIYFPCKHFIWDNRANPLPIVGYKTSLLMKYSWSMGSVLALVVMYLLSCAFLFVGVATLDRHLMVDGVPALHIPSGTGH